MKTIVTGGCGFIGSHVTDLLLSEGHEVHVLDNFSTGRRENLAHAGEGVKITECDLSQQGQWSEAFRDVQWVFHLAALADIVPSIRQPDKYFRANVDGTFHVLQAAREHGVKRFVYAASSSCYGIPDAFPTKETAAIRPQYPYALTKRLGEELVLHWHQVYGLPAVSLRLFNVYGPRSRTSGTYGAMFGVFLAQKLAAKPFTIVGDGEQTRDFTYVTDVAAAFLTAAKSGISGEIFNVGSGQTVSVNRIAELLQGKTVHIPRRPGEPDCTFADVAKIQAQLGWKAKVSIEEGVDELLKNIAYWKNAPVWEPDSIAKETEDWFKYLSSAKK